MTADHEKKQAAGSKNRSELVMGVTLIVLVIGVLFAWVQWTISAKEREMRGQLESRLTLMAASRAEVISSWLRGMDQQVDRLISSDLFRLYATEIDMIDTDPGFLITGDIPAGGKHDHMAQLADQLSIMQQSFSDFAAFGGFLSGRVVHRSGQSFINSASQLVPLTPMQSAMIRKTFASPGITYAPLRSTESGLVLDICAPIQSAASGGNPGKAAAVVLLTRSAVASISSFLAASPLAGAGERTRLIQLSDTVYQEVVPWAAGGLLQLASAPGLDGRLQLPFAQREGASDHHLVYSVGVKIPETSWWVVQELDAADAFKDVHDYARTALLVAVLIALVLCLLFGALWWRTVGRNNARIAEEFRTLALELERQHSLLDSINDSVPDFIAVKNLDGIYTYANPALADGVGRREDEVLGLDDLALFGFDTGKRLEESDRAALQGTLPVTVAERIYLKSCLHHFQITKVVLRDDSHTPWGIAAVFRDITSLVEAQERKDQTVRQTVDALVKAVEFIDPYLAGHSQLMREVGMLLAEGMKLSEQDCTTVEIASNLSQIGKIFVDKALLHKTETLSDEEKLQVQKHVEHAGAILRQISFELPVCEAVCQMNERPDGSGYPRGLRGDELLLPARVLAVANSFCAMIRPRAYRPAMSAERALEVLRKAGAGYDQTVVEALGAALQSARGGRLLDKARE